MVIGYDNSVESSSRSGSTQSWQAKCSTFHLHLKYTASSIAYQRSYLYLAFQHYLDKDSWRRTRKPQARERQWHAAKDQGWKQTRATGVRIQSHMLCNLLGEPVILFEKDLFFFFLGVSETGQCSDMPLWGRWEWQSNRLMSSQGCNL